MITHTFLFNIFVICFDFKVEKLRFSPILFYFVCYFRFRPLDVLLYAFRSKNENFLPKIRAPRARAMRAARRNICSHRA